MEFEIFKYCHFIQDGNIIGITKTKPTIEEGKGYILFKNVYLTGCLYEHYVNDEMEIHIFEESEQEPSIIITDAEMINFGYIHLMTKDENFQYVKINVVDFCYSEITDKFQRIKGPFLDEEDDETPPEKGEEDIPPLLLETGE